MKRNVDLNEISDGRLYSANDMVKVECGDCAGCSACCQNMGTSVVLDPMDIWKMQRGTGRMLEKLLKKRTGAECCGWNYFAQSAYERNERGLFLSE